MFLFLPRQSRREGVRATLTGEVMSPQGPDLVLTPDVPYIEFDILIRDCLNVEAHRGDRRDILVEFEFV